MDNAFVLLDADLMDVLTRATNDDLAALIEVMRQARSCWLDRLCRAPLAIADELQKLGGNTLANRRGHGVKYAEIVSDVADKVGAKLKDATSVAHME